MKWDLEELRRKSDHLAKMFTESKNELEKEELKKELMILSNMIESISCSAILKARFKPQIDVKKETLDEKCKFFSETLPVINDKSAILEYSRRLPLYWITKTKISEKDYLKVIEEFLKTFKLDLNPLYATLRADNCINVTEFNFFNTLGVCYYFPFLKESYINLLFDKKIEDTKVLPHELGHAYLFNGTNFEQKYNMTVSSLGEAFSMFIQLAFYDYLKETRYFKNAINMEREFLESLATIYEVNNEFFTYANNVRTIDNRFVNSYHKTFSEKSASVFLSKMLAYYFINLYRSGNISKIQEFCSAYQNGVEYDYFRSINPEDFKNSLKLEFDYFYQSIIDHKKLIKK